MNSLLIMFFCCLSGVVRGMQYSAPVEPARQLYDFLAVPPAGSVERLPQYYPPESYAYIDQPHAPSASASSYAPMANTLAPPSTNALEKSEPVYRANNNAPPPDPLLKTMSDGSAQRPSPETHPSMLPPAERRAFARSVLKDHVSEEAAITTLRVQAPKRDIEEKISLGKELDFYVKNSTGQKLFVVCFSYINKVNFNRWRWDKSKIYTLAPGETKLINIDFIPDPTQRESIYGFLGTFSNYDDADMATYELLKDTEKLDLDLLYRLKNKTVNLIIERYGFKGESLDLRLARTDRQPIQQPELDFVVENRTGKTILVTCFVYQKDPDKEDLTTWAYKKTPIIRLETGQQGIVNIDTLRQLYDWVYTRGYLAVFDETDYQLANEATYEMLTPHQKLNLNRLADLQGKKILLGVERYGIEGNIIDFTVQPIRRIKFGAKK